MTSNTGGASPLQRLGALPSTSRIARIIEHNRDIRRRLIADIEANAARLGLSGDALRAQLTHLTGQRRCSDLVLKQLRLVARVLRRQVSPPAREGARAGGDAAAAIGSAAAAPSPSSTPREDTT